jgi:hypothetical protein
MESDNGCALLLKLNTQLKINARHDLNEGAPRIGKHVDVGVCKFKSFKGLFHKPIINNKRQHLIQG